ncbi:beta-propeller fold lactonase family protein [Candidatus Venteria ishoeyi]|nr:beta-propeller fold lactonase family protein [Candidatus Venteria ishoeyi]
MTASINFPFIRQCLILLFFYVFSAQVQALTFIQAQIHNQNGVSGLAGATSVALSPDSKQVYATGLNSDSIVVFSRDAQGSLTFQESHAEGIATVSGMNGPNHVLLSPDGKQVYVASLLGSAIAQFNRDTSTGSLSFIEAVTDGVRGANGLTAPNHLAMDSNGLHLYVTSSVGLSSFSRDSSSGALSFISLQQNGTGGVANLSGANSAVVSGDGKQVYAIALADNAIVTFNRNTTSGDLSFVGSHVNGVAGIDGLGGAYDLDISNDGTYLFATGSSDNALVVFQRNVADGSLTYLETHYNGIAGVTGLLSPRAITSSTDNQKVYVGGNSSNALVMFDVLGSASTTGHLSFIEAQVNGINGVQGIAGISDIQLTADNSQLYTSAIISQAVALFSANAADLSLSMSAPVQGEINQPLVYLLKVSNLGPETASAVTVNNTLAVTANFVSATSSQGSCSHNSGLLVCSLGNLAAGSSIDINLTLNTSIAGTLSNTATVSAPEPDVNPNNNSASAAIEVVSKIPLADLAVTLQASPNPVNAGSALDYSASISNLGPDAAENSQLQFILPTGTTLDSFSAEQGSCQSPVGNQVNCTLGTVMSGVDTHIQFRLITPALSSTLAASVSVSADQSDPDPNNNSASLSVDATNLQTDLELLSLTADKTDVALGQTLLYTAVFANPGTWDTSSIKLSQVFTPANGVIYQASNTNAPNAPNPGSPCVERAQGDIDCSLGTLDALGNPPTFALQISVLPTLPGSLSALAGLSANATDVLPDNNEQSLNVNVTGEATDAEVTLLAVPNPASVGNPVVFTATIRNTSADGTITGLTLTSNVPSQTQFIGALPAQGTCSENVGQIQCVLGDIAPETSTTVAITLKPLTETPIQLSAQIGSTSFDPNPGNDAASLIVNVGQPSVDLAATLSATPEPVLVGDELTYHSTITNQGPDPASAAVVTLNLPANVVYIAATVDQQNANCLENSGVVSCALGSLASSASAVLDIRTLSQTVTTLEASISVNSIETDPDLSNNTATVSSTVFGPKDLSFYAAYVDATLDSNGQLITGLQGVTPVALSPDGKHLYAGGFLANALLVMARDVTDGTLTVIEVLREGENGVSGLNKPAAIDFNADGSQVFVSGFGGNTLSRFERNASTGQLSFAQVVQPDTLTSPYSLISRDGFLYVASLGTDSVLVFQASDLSLLETHNNSTGGQGLNGVNTLAISPDGLQLYAVSMLDHALVVFNRDAASGSLSFAQVFSNGNGASGLSGADGLVVSPDNRHIYVAGGNDNSVVAFQRDLTANTLSFVASNTSGQLFGVAGLAINPAGSNLYAASTNANSLSVFTRDSQSGKLDLTTQFFNQQDGVSGLGGARSVIASSDGQHMYATGLIDHAITLFRLPSADLQISAEAAPAQPSTGQDITYSLTASNTGLDDATGVVLTASLDPGLNPVTAMSSKGAPCTIAGQNVLCQIGALLKNTQASVTITATPVEQGELSLRSTLNATQVDPDETNNQSVLTLDVLGTANLMINMTTDAAIVAQEADVTYQITVTNGGPDSATQVTLTNILPASLSFVSGNFNGQACVDNSGVVTCILDTLLTQAEALGEIRLKTLQAGTVLNNVEVTSEQNDPSLPNRATASIEVVLNVIDTDVDNTGQILSNYTITETGVVRNGSLSGNINNNGLLENVTVLPDGLITGTGQLSGIINNQGTLENARLAANTVINGGTITGIVAGDANAPGAVTATIAAGAQLSHVLINIGSVVDPAAVLGAGVRFSDASLIPAGINLNGIFSLLHEPYTQAWSVNLNQDVTLSDPPLLDAINALPMLSGNGMVLGQFPYGHLLTSLPPGAVSMIPLLVSQMPIGTPAGVEVNSDGSVIFTTPTGRSVLALSALRSPEVMSALITPFGLTMQAQFDGSLDIPLAVLGSRLHMRPDLVILPPSAPDNGVMPGEFAILPSALPNVPLYALLFNDEAGTRWQQNLYSSAIDNNAWTALEAIPGIDAVTLNLNGSLSVLLGADSHGGILDYTILPGVATGSPYVDLQPITDRNADGVADLMVIYPNGDQQILFYLPPPDLADEVQAIPVVQQLALQVSRTAENYLQLDHPATGNRYMLNPGPRVDAPAGSVPNMTINLDGSLFFITPALKQFSAQPVVQNLTLFNQALSGLNLGPATLDSNGNLRIADGAVNRQMARPDPLSTLLSTLAPVGSAAGLSLQPSGIPGIENMQLVFADEQGRLRQQLIFPASDNPTALADFLSAQAGVTEVNFILNGQVQINGSSSVNGMLTYAVNQSGTPGAMQLTPIPDVNGDTIADFVIHYLDGSTQILYRLN